MNVIDVDGQLFTDEEIAAQALAADPDLQLGDDVVPLSMHRREFGNVLPDWYMPPPSAHGPRRRNAVIATVIIASLLLVNALGLCITYGRLEVPF